MSATVKTEAMSDVPSSSDAVAQPASSGANGAAMQHGSSSNGSSGDAMDTSASGVGHTHDPALALKTDPNSIKSSSAEHALPAIAVPPASDAAAAPSTRDEYAKTEEDRGIISFPVVTNDGVPTHSIALIGLKNIFSAQLPKMPKEYIVRLVMDRNHRSMCIMKKSASSPGGQKVIGGITFRPFVSQAFAEIVFCAITSTEQVKGYGTRLMNQLKEHVKTEQIRYFLTYADNYAIGYFKKQGFTKTISQPRDRWSGFIKDYDGGTLMECDINQKVDYLRLSEIITRQRHAVYEQIKKVSNSHIVYPGIKKFAQQQQQQIQTESQSQQEGGSAEGQSAGGEQAATGGADGAAKRAPLPDGMLIDPMEIPGIKESGWRPEPPAPPPSSAAGGSLSTRTSLGAAGFSDLHARIGLILKALRAAKDAWPFARPVDIKLVPDYTAIIKQPMDLETIGKKLNNFEYKTKETFIADCKRIIQNCMTYNTPDTTYYRCAQHMDTLMDKLFAQHFTS